MRSEVRLVTEVWEAVRDLPAAKRAEAAIGIVRAFVEYGFDKRDLAGLSEEDEDLAAAFEEVFTDADEDEDDEDVEGDYDSEED
jgi:hypothetical protein